MTIHSALETYFGFTSFRDQQEKIINTVLQKKDCLVIMPTGGGKSLCYQLPAIITGGLTIVMSPLIALMKDQVDDLRQKGIPCACINSSQEEEEQQAIMQQLKDGQLKLLYLAPERLSAAQGNFIFFLKQLNITLVAVDEAHCISQWGPDFRPDYLNLNVFKDLFPHVPLVALTATANASTRADIVEKLQLSSPEIFISDFNRPNIRYIINKKKRYFEKLLEFLQMHKGESGIVYCMSRAETEMVARKLVHKGFTAMAYHAGMEHDERTECHELFKNNSVSIIVATIAFGMGIDKPDVRFVVHTTLPQHIEGYYQETGRAGRDGLHSDALLFYAPVDIIRLKKLIRVPGDPVLTKIFENKLKQMQDFCVSDVCRRKQLLNYFGEETADTCGNCDICLGMSEIIKEEEKPKAPVVKQERNTPVFEATTIAARTLSAVLRLKGKFGVTYVVDLLRATGGRRVWKEHTRFKEFGLLRSIPEYQLLDYIDQLIDLGYLEKTQESEYTFVRVTKTAHHVMFQHKKVMLHEPPVPVVKETSAEQYEKALTSLQPNERALFDALCDMRYKLSMAVQLPAFTLFSDELLMALAENKPLNMEALATIPGLDKNKILNYGSHVIKAINAFAASSSGNQSTPGANPVDEA